MCEGDVGSQPLRPICYDGVCVFEEAAILESHGIEVESPGGQSNSDEVDASDFPDQVSPLPHALPPVNHGSS